MAETILDLNEAWELPIKGIYEGNSFVIPLERFQDEDMTIPENWPAAEYMFSISDIIDGSGDVLKLTTEDSQIEIVDNTMTITCTKEENTLFSEDKKAGKTYYYDLIADFGNGLTKVEGRGTLICHPSVGK